MRISISNNMALAGRIILLLVLAVIIQGCSTGSRAHRGKLSDAMERASTDYEGERRMPEPESSPEPDWDFDSVLIFGDEDDEPCVGDNCPEPGSDSTDADPEVHGPPLPPVPAPVWFFGFSGGVGPMKSEDFDPMTRAGIFAGTYIGSHLRWELHIGGSWAPIQDTSELDKSLKDGVFLFNAGLDLKAFLASRKVFLTPYIIFGAAYNHMWWNYENPIITFDGETIHGDNLEGYEIHAGAGLQLAQTNHFQVGAEVVPSLIIWEGATGRGFENDVFDPFYLLMFRATVTFLP